MLIEEYVAGHEVSVEAPSGAYPMVTFYEPVRYAASHGLKLVVLGETTLRAKILRGARVRELTAYTLACSRRGTGCYRQLAALLESHVRAQTPELAPP